MTVYYFLLLFAVIDVVNNFLCLYNFIRSLLLCNRRKVRGGDISKFGFLLHVRFRVS